MVAAIDVLLLVTFIECSSQMSEKEREVHTLAAALEEENSQGARKAAVALDELQRLHQAEANVWSEKEAVYAAEMKAVREELDFVMAKVTDLLLSFAHAVYNMILF